MKKHITIAMIILLVPMCVFLSACSSQSKQPQPIELTIDNIEQYLTMQFEYMNFKSTRLGDSSLSVGSVELLLSTYTARSGSFDDVSITLEISTIGWKATSTDAAYIEEDDESTLILNFKLPSDGRYNETLKFGSFPTSSKPDLSYLMYTITNVSGTFIPAN